MCACSVTQLCPTLSDPIDYRPPGSSVHEIVPARILEWVVISYSRGFSPLADWSLSPAAPALTGESFPLSHLESLLHGTVDLKKNIYLVTWPNHMSYLKAEHFIGHWQDGKPAIQSVRTIWCPVTDLKMEEATWQEVWAASIRWEWPLTADQKGHGDLRPTTLRKWIHPTTWMSLELYIYNTRKITEKDTQCPSVELAHFQLAVH